MSGRIDFDILYDHREYTPGETFSGKVRWSAGSSPVEEVIVRLFWFTNGRGSRDTGIVDEQRWDTAGRSQGDVEFSFVLPFEPFSFSGSLITLTWALEAILKPDDSSELFEFFLSPTGKEIVLEPVENPKSDLENKARRYFEDRFRNHRK